jgi:hypothetical protein
LSSHNPGRHGKDGSTSVARNPACCFGDNPTQPVSKRRRVECGDFSSVHPEQVSLLRADTTPLSSRRFFQSPDQVFDFIRCAIPASGDEPEDGRGSRFIDVTAAFASFRCIPQ